MKCFVVYELKCLTRGKIPFRISRLGANAWDLEELQRRRKTLQEEAGLWGILRLPDDIVERESVLSLAEHNLRMPTQSSLDTKTAYICIARLEDGSDYIAGWFYRMKDLPYPTGDFITVIHASMIHRGSKISVSGTRPVDISKDIWSGL